MPKNRITILLAVIIILLPSPLVGLPTPVEAVIQVVAGLAIIATTMWATIDRKLSLKAKAQMRQTRKIPPPVTPPGVVPPLTDEFGKRVTDFYPKTGQSGRRASDIIPPGPGAPTN